MKFYNLLLVLNDLLSRLVLTFIISCAVLYCDKAICQQEIGFGIHYSPPANITYQSNSYTKVKPLPSHSFSFAYRKSWKSKNHIQWYREFGISSFSLSYNVQNYFNDTIQVWGEFNTLHRGYPTVYLGIGRKFKSLSEKRNMQFEIGIEGDFVVSHSLNEMLTANFGIISFQDDEPFPFLFRLLLGYCHGFKILDKIPANIQLYSKITPQLITRGSQYLKDRVSGAVQNDGNYKLNGSESGLKLYIDIDKNNFKFSGNMKKISLKKKRKNHTKYRISVDGQAFVPKKTDYFIPLVDSFSLSGLNFSITTQVGLRAEFLNGKSEDFAFISGIGYGKNMTTTKFSALSRFTTDGNVVDNQSGQFLGYFIIPNIGLGYKHKMNKLIFNHSLVATCVVPITKENDDIIMLEQSYQSIPLHLVPNIILNGNMNYNFGRDNFLLGIEYQPELLFGMDKKIFYGLGMVFNYSRGIVGQGRVKVTNGITTYHGGVIQGFSKLGVTFRVGFNSYSPDI